MASLLCPRCSAPASLRIRPEIASLSMSIDCFPHLFRRSPCNEDEVAAAQRPIPSISAPLAFASQLNPKKKKVPSPFVSESEHLPMPTIQHLSSRCCSVAASQGTRVPPRSCLNLHSSNPNRGVLMFVLELITTLARDYCFNPGANRVLLGFGI